MSYFLTEGRFPYVLKDSTELTVEDEAEFVEAQTDIAGLT